MKYYLLSITGSLVAASLAIAATGRGPIQCKAEITVVDKENQPIQGVKVVAGFAPGGKMGGAKRTQEGMTDAEGKITLTDQSIFPISIYATKDGYYRSHTELPIYREKKVGVYEPINNPQSTVLLRKSRDPIPMYAKRINVTMPVIGKSIGFDFEAGDWVAPYGSGNAATVELKMTKDVSSNDEYTQILEVSFPNKGDGIGLIEENEDWRASEFRWFYQAPDIAFEGGRSFVRSRKQKKGLTSKAGGAKYLLRVKTQLDAAGEVVLSNYVRLESNLSLFGVLSDEPGFKFTYYFNPTANDRNLEFDPERNLFTDLPVSERVLEP